MPELTFDFKTAGDEMVIGALREIGAAAAEAVAAGIEKLIESFASLAEMGSALQNATTALDFAITKQGDNAAVTAAQADALAQSMRDLAGGNATTVTSAEAVLLKFREINSSMFPDALKLTADLAAQMGIDLPAAAQMLGRGLENPTLALRLLKQVGAEVTPEFTKMISELVKHGETAKADALIMSALGDVIGGKAASAAGTLSGQWAILSGHAAQFGEEIGSHLLPMLMKLLDVVGPMLDQFYAIFERTFLPLIDMAGSWGQGFVNAFSGGMQSAFGVVEQVITELGNMIAGFMAPGSPPKFLPLLDVWGREAVDVYLKGWTTFDKTVFDEIGKAIKAGLPAEEIQQYADTMHKLADANDVVTAAQDALNAVTAHYDAIITPLNDKLKGLSNQQQVINDKATIAKLQAIQSDTGYSEDQKAAARIEIQKILLKEQIAAAELEKTKAVDNAKDKLTAAQTVSKELADQAKLQTTAIDIQAQMTQQINQGAAAMTTAHAAAGAFHAAVAALGGGLKTLGDHLKDDNVHTNAMALALLNAQKVGEGMVTSFKAAWEQAVKDMQPVFDAVGRLIKAFQDSGPTVQTALKDFAGYVLGQFDILKPVLIANVTSMLDSLTLMWKLNGDGIIALVKLAMETAVTVLSAAFILYSGATTVGLDLVNFQWQKAADDRARISDAFWSAALALAGTNLTDYNKVWKDNGDMLLIIVGKAWDAIKGRIQDTIDSVKASIKQAVDDITGIVNGLISLITGVHAPSAPVYGPPAPTRAGGGPVFGGSTYLVGEQGPELFTAPRGGMIIPNNQLGQSSGAQVVIHVDARGSFDPSAVEAAGYRGALRAMQVAGYRADQISRMGV